jgi:hypothetical protein
MIEQPTGKRENTVGKGNKVGVNGKVVIPET